MKRHVREGIEKYFQVTITPEIRSIDAYVMTAVEGKTPPPKKSGDFSFVAATNSATRWQQTFQLPEGTAATRRAVEEATRRAMDSLEFRQAMAMAQLVSVSALSSSMDDLRRALEDGRQRPVVDETNLTGIYDFTVQGEARSTDEFLGMLRDQLGIVLTPTRRSTEMTVVRSVE